MAPTLPLRIAILMCDSPLPKTTEKYGSYGGVFTALLRSSADSLSAEIPGFSADTGLDITTWDVDKLEEYPELDDVDAILMTGSRANSFDDQPWILKLVDFTKKALSHPRVRILGICFGHQILGRALSLPVGRNPNDWELSVVPVSLTTVGHNFFYPASSTSTPPQPPARETQSFLSLLQMHRDEIHPTSPSTSPPSSTHNEALPSPILSLGYTEKCANQGMLLPGKFVSVQGHPEFTAEIVREMLDTRVGLGVISQEMYRDAVGRVGDRHDGLVVGRAMLRFLLE